MTVTGGKGRYLRRELKGGFLGFLTLTPTTLAGQVRLREAQRGEEDLKMKRGSQGARRKIRGDEEMSERREGDLGSS